MVSRSDSLLFLPLFVPPPHLYEIIDKSAGKPSAGANYVNINEGGSRGGLARKR